MSIKLIGSADLWRDNFDEMADAIHNYILETTDSEELEYSNLSDNNRREVETGYHYSGEEFDLSFNLAGTVNDDPQILKDGKRRLVFRTGNFESAYRDILQSLEHQSGSNLDNRKHGDIETYELEINPPYP